MKLRYEFADGTVSEFEVEESIGAIIIEDRRLEDNFLYDYRKSPFFMEKNILVRSPSSKFFISKKYYEWRIRK